MSAYRKLLEEVYDFIKGRGKVTFDELRSWAEAKDIGPVTLSMIVNDLINEGKIVGEGGERELEDEPIALPVPNVLKVIEGMKRKGTEEEKEVREEIPLRMQIIPRREGRTQEKSEERKPTKVSKKILTSPLFASLREELEIEIEEEPKLKEEVKEEAKEVGASDEEGGAVLEGVDEDLKKAIEYLNLYWSVGEIRFLQDLSALGVKEPRKVLYRLMDLGYVVRKPLGVIDATDKLPKVKVDKVKFELSAFM